MSCPQSRAARSAHCNFFKASSILANWIDCGQLEKRFSQEYESPELKTLLRISIHAALLHYKIGFDILESCGEEGQEVLDYLFNQCLWPEQKNLHAELMQVANKISYINMDHNFDMHKLINLQPPIDIDFLVRLESLADSLHASLSGAFNET